MTTPFPITQVVFGDKIPDGMFICHHCDNPPCINPGHLFLGTHADNMKDMALKGRCPNGAAKGEGNGQAKLTNNNVIEIKDFLSKAIPQAKIALLYNVSHSTISLIKLGKSWSHI